MLLTGATSMTCVASMVPTALPSSRTRCSPVAVTTTASSSRADWASSKSTVAEPPASTVNSWATGP